MGENKPIREIETTIDEIEGLVINIGRVYENKVTKLLVDLSSTLVEHPNATASLVVRQPNWQSYPATVTLNGMTLEWLITDAEIGLQSGTGEIQITVADGEQIYKSAIAQTVILPSILYKSGSIPDPIAHWISQAQAELEKTKEALSTAQNFISDLKQKLDNGELNGKPGPQGEKGEKGDPGKDAPQEAVLYTAQMLDDAQKVQARENIGAADEETVDQLKSDIDNLDDTVFNVIQEPKDCTSDATILSDKFACIFTGADKRLLFSINDGKDICDCYVISVNENDKFQVKGLIYNDNLYYPLIVMSSASFSGNNVEQTSLVTAENGNYKYWGTGNETEIYEFVIPKGVKTLFVNKFSGESEFLLKKYVDVKKSRIPTKISELENDTLFLSNEMYAPEYNIYTGQIRGSDDYLPVYDVKDDGAYQVTEMIPVSKGDKIYYSGNFYSHPAVALYDELGTFVSDLSKNLKIYTTYNDVEVGEVTHDGFVAAYSYKIISGNNVKLALNVYGNKAKNEVKSCYKMNYLYVATTGNDESGDGTCKS